MPSAFDELLTELRTIPGKHPIGREDLERALISVALRDCRPGFITVGGDEATFTLEGVLTFVLAGSENKQATAKMRQIASLIQRATDEVGAGT